MTRAFTMVPGLLALLAAGCSGGASGQLDCAWLAGENCWKTTVASATTCLPPATETGVLSADNKTCTYASGATITFTPALTLPVSSGATAAAPWNFTISKGGVDCLHFESSQPTMKLVVGDQTFLEGSTGGTGLGVTCPDGTTYAAANAFALLECGADGGASFGGLPGYSHSSGASSVRFGLIGAASSVPVFNCQR